MIKKYSKKDGSTAWLFKTYLGIDPLTRKKRYTTRRGFSTQKEAKLALSRLQIEVEKNGLVTSETSSFTEIYQLWLEQYKNTVKESTLFIQTNAIKLHIIPRFGHLQIDKITTTFCQRQVNDWFSYYSKYSNLIGLTSRIFDFAITMNQLNQNPMKNVIRPRKKSLIDDSQYKSTFYDKKQLEKFLNALDEEENKEMFLMFRLLGFTGIRKGELLALRWKDIDFSKSTLSIKQTLARDKDGGMHFQTPKTKESIRTISIDEKTMSYIFKWRSFQKELFFKKGINTSKQSQLLFTDFDNQHHYIDYPNNFLKKFLIRNDLSKITIHGFRHTHCSLLFEAGISIKEVQERLGHTDIKTTMDVYAHVTEKAKEETAEKYAAYLNF